MNGGGSLRGSILTGVLAGLAAVGATFAVLLAISFIPSRATAGFFGVSLLPLRQNMGAGFVHDGPLVARLSSAFFAPWNGAFYGKGWFAGG
ncbi:MAG TPA: hypothetical protein VJ787_09595 [Thermoleophilia bacterium]|nr:hypothetical protein [Thermoleophilia bacterium]